MNERTDMIRLEVRALQVVNFALQQNGVQILEDVVIHNDGPALEQVSLEICSQPEFCQRLSQHIDFLPADASFQVRGLELQLNAAFLASLTERVTGTLQLCLMQGETCLAEASLELTALAYDQWHGLGIHPELLCAFVTPNHPEIARLTARAAELLGKWTGDPSLDAYQSQDPNRVLAQAAAVYGAIQERSVVYAVPPASFEAVGQRLRLCDAVLEQKLGTCLDLSLLYTACLEAIGLHPLLILKQGHAFAGLWLEDLTFSESVQDDASLVTKRLAEGIQELAVVECTALTAGKQVSFDEAAATAQREMNDVEAILDVTRARLSGVRPIPMRVHTEDGWRFEEADHKAAVLTGAPKTVSGPLDLSNGPAETPASKKLRWERKLLDLGLRNALINLRLSKSMIPILASSLDELENALSDGEDFDILPRPADWNLGGADFETMHELGSFTALIQSEFQNHRLRSVFSEAELGRAIKELYRSARTSMEENGANTLYLALGLLKWFENPRSTKARYAPLILVPIEMVRKSASEGYRIRLRDDDAQMNITMLEKLKQDFQMEIHGLDPLPADEHGIDTRRVFTLLRKAIMGQKNWDVLESAYLGIFSFSQFVMWNDIRNRSEDLARNKIVKSLMDGRLAWDAEEMELGRKVPEDRVLLPLSADASQLFAIEAACQGESFVLHGPPGTGKSQTITALIANALAQGRSVLFVAEKMAALEVVQRRLDKIGIGAFCLELHSNQSKKRNVLEQLRQATEVTRYQSSQDYAAKAEQIAQVRAELDAYADALHQPLQCGLSVFDLIGRYEASRDAQDLPPFRREILAHLTASDLERQRILVQRLVAAARAVGHPARHPLAPVGQSIYSQQLRMQLPERTAAYRSALQAVRPEIERFCSTLELRASSYRQLEIGADLARELQLWLTLPKSWAKAEDLNRTLLQAEALCAKARQELELRQTILARWKPSFLSQDAGALLTEYQANETKWALARLLGSNSLVKRLAPHALQAVQKETLGTELEVLGRYQTVKQELDRLRADCGSSLRELDRGDATDWTQVAVSAAQARESAKRLAGMTGSEQLRLRFCGEDGLRPVIETTLAAWEAFLPQRADFYQFLGIREHVGERWFDQQLALCDALMQRSDEMREWISWNAAVQEAELAGLSNIVQAYRGGMAHEAVAPAYEKSISQALVMEAIDASPALSRFSGAVFNEQIQQFRQLDAELMELAKQEIYCRLASRVPNFAREAAQSSELGILQRAIRSGGRGISIRRLFEQLPELLPRLCPCMLMSPISAAQYLDPNRKPFDIVVFDEASQLPTCKAVGVLARGENAVIVGDPKQMPPTTFFATNTLDEEHIETEDLESILDDCLALNLPQTHLLWHYRSRHESLIAFSNHQFYENKLYTFPSVNDRETKVRLVSIDGRFDRGKTRQNRAEAEAVVAELKRRCHDPKDSGLSVGVVTFNINQQNLIEDLLTEACRSDEALEAWAYHSEENIFIKNLENVQGDERDVILFSVGYGPDENGKVSMNFGPLNRDGGWRRLNVAVSRARCEMIVFSALRPDQINLSRTSAEGVAALRAFLEYAGGQALWEDENTVSVRRAEPEGVAAAICKALEERGYATDRLVGHSEFRIDIGVVDPKAPERYLLGILLDGSAYGAAKTTRRIIG